MTALWNAPPVIFGPNDNSMEPRECRTLTLLRAIAEAGHAAVAFHHGLKLLYVTMEPPSDSGHWGQTATAAPNVMDLDQLEIAMQVAAAGDIARSWFLPTREADREERTDDRLMKRFRNAARAVAESDPWFRDVDRLIFAERGRERDAEMGGHRG